MKKMLVITLLLATGVVFAHSGRTDKNGCHRDTKAGTVHCH